MRRVSDDGGFKRVTAAADRLSIKQTLHQADDRFLSALSIFKQRPNNHLHTDRFLADVPHVVIGDMRHSRVTDFCLARQKSLGAGGHADD